MAFKDFGGQPLYCPFDDVLMISIGEIQREDGQRTLLVDFIRRSTPITPRIDSGLFDFGRTLDRPGANVEDLFSEIQMLIDVPFDRRFQDVIEHLESVYKGFASHPSEYPPKKLPSPYVKFPLRNFNLYSLLMRERLLALGQDGKTEKTAPA